MNLLLWASIWLVFAVVIGTAAAGRGRSGVWWFVLAMLTSPLVAGLLLALLGTTPEVAARRTAAALGAEVPRPDTHVRCPECRELVRGDARKCKHCGVALVPQAAQDSPAAY